MKKPASGLLILIAVAGCSHEPAEPIVLTRTEVLTREVPISTTAPPPPPSIAMAPAAPCIPRVGPAPAYPDRDEALREAPSIYEQVQLLLAGRRMRMERERELSDALRSCARGRR